MIKSISHLDAELAKIYKKRVLSLNDLVRVGQLYQQANLDFYLHIAGRNGVGKSTTALSLMKLYYGKLVFDNVFYADVEMEEVIIKLKQKEKELFVFDEANVILEATRHMKNYEIVNVFEHVREKNHFIITISRTLKQMNLRYRDGKLNVLVYLNDINYEKKNIAGYILHQTGVEGIDKFNIDMLIHKYGNIEKALSNYHTALLKDTLKLSDEEYKQYKNEKIRRLENSVSLDEIMKIESRIEKRLKALYIRPGQLMKFKKYANADPVLTYLYSALEKKIQRDKENKTLHSY